MKGFVCQSCGKHEEILASTYDKRIMRGTALKCRECLFDRSNGRKYSPEVNDYIWEQIKLELGL